MVKLSVCSIVKDEEFFIPAMIKSAAEFADEIIIVVDKETRDHTIGKITRLKIDNVDIKYFVLDFKDDFGKARQFANDKATGDWIFFLDADEVIHELQTSNIKKAIEICEKDNIDVIHVEYVHFINDFKHIDNSEPVHVGLNRLYKKYKNIKFINKNHSLPSSKSFRGSVFFPQIIIWHMGYLRGMEKIKERFLRNYTFSEMHSPWQQVRWRDWHYFGDYPTREIEINTIPKVIRELYLMDLGGGRLG